MNDQEHQWQPIPGIDPVVIDTVHRHTDSVNRTRAALNLARRALADPGRELPRDLAEALTTELQAVLNTNSEDDHHAG